jgi:hypothetical protein
VDRFKGVFSACGILRTHGWGGTGKALVSRAALSQDRSTSLLVEIQVHHRLAVLMFTLVAHPPPRIAVEDILADLLFTAYASTKCVIIDAGEGTA